MTVIAHPGSPPPGLNQAAAVNDEPAISPFAPTVPFPLSPATVARVTFSSNVEWSSAQGELTAAGVELANAVLAPGTSSTVGAQVCTFAVDGIQSSDILVVKRVPASETGTNVLLYIPDVEGNSFFEFNNLGEMNAWLKEVATDPDKLDVFAGHFSRNAPADQTKRVKDTMTRFAAGDINAVVGPFGYEKGDIFNRLDKHTSVPPVPVNGLTGTYLKVETRDGRVTFAGTRPDGETVLYQYDAYGNFHGGGNKGNFYFVKNGLNNDQPLSPVSREQYLKTVVSVSLDNVGANDLWGLFDEFIRQLKNPGSGIGTALIALGVPEDVAQSIEKIVKNPVTGTLLELNQDNRLGKLFGVEKAQMDAALTQIGDEIQGRIPYYGAIRGGLSQTAVMLEMAAKKALSGLLLTHQMLEAFKHQHHHREPDRKIRQPFPRLDAFAQQQGHAEQQHRFYIAEQPEQAEGQQAAGDDVAHQRRRTDQAQHRDQGVQALVGVEHGKTLFAALHEPQCHRQHQRHIEPQPAEVVGLQAFAQYEVNRVADNHYQGCPGESAHLIQLVQHTSTGEEHRNLLQA